MAGKVSGIAQRHFQPPRVPVDRLKVNEDRVFSRLSAAAFESAPAGMFSRVCRIVLKSVKKGNTPKAGING